MRTLISTLLFCTIASFLQAQAPWAIQVSESGDQATARTIFGSMAADIKADPLLKELYADHLRMGSRAAGDEHFVYYFNPSRQSEAEVTADLAGLTHFVYDKATKFRITELKALKVRSTKKAATEDPPSAPTRDARSAPAQDTRTTPSR